MVGLLGDVLVHVWLSYHNTHWVLMMLSVVIRLRSLGFHHALLFLILLKKLCVEGMQLLQIHGSYLLLDLGEILRCNGPNSVQQLECSKLIGV